MQASSTMLAVSPKIPAAAPGFFVWTIPRRPGTTAMPSPSSLNAPL